ncbi:MAG: disulfide bond formation protein DsbA [Betaproteobacteria bacterium]|nr:disulfide bond formation protein DsbA [Betaproteobacteria bacterium]
MLERIDVISDVVCPWCMIGKRRLERALDVWRERHPGHSPIVAWHAFELNPDMPRTGMDRRTYTAQKFGGPERAREVYARVAAAGREEGIAFDFDRISVQPNTVQAHRLISWAGGQGLQTDVVERLFSAYFLEAQDLSRDDVLARLASESGLDGDAAAAFLAGDELAGDVAEDERMAHAIGVQGVPFFIFDQRLALSGAHPADVIVEAMEEAAAQAPA